MGSSSWGFDGGWKGCRGIDGNMQGGGGLGLRCLLPDGLCSCWVKERRGLRERDGGFFGKNGKCQKQNILSQLFSFFPLSSFPSILLIVK